MTENRPHFLLSVQARIIVITLVIITLVLGAYAAYDIHRKKAISDRELRELARVTAQKLENNLRIPLWDLDADLVSDTVEAEMLTRDISAILVFDSNGEDLVSGRQRNANWAILEASADYRPSDDNEIEREVVIRNKQAIIGSVQVFVSKRFEAQALNESIIALLATLFLLDVLIFVVLWLVMSNILRKPITRLSDAANQISRGHFDVVIDTQRGDEIGIVAMSIDRMKISLRMAIERLRRIEEQKKAKTAGGGQHG